MIQEATAALTHMASLDPCKPRSRTQRLGTVERREEWKQAPRPERRGSTWQRDDGGKTVPGLICSFALRGIVKRVWNAQRPRRNGRTGLLAEPRRARRAALGLPWRTGAVVLIDFLCTYLRLCYASGALGSTFYA